MTFWKFCETVSTELEKYDIDICSVFNNMDLLYETWTYDFQYRTIKNNKDIQTVVEEILNKCNPPEAGQVFVNKNNEDEKVEVLYSSISNSEEEEILIVYKSESGIYHCLLVEFFKLYKKRQTIDELFQELKDACERTMKPK